MYLGAAQSHVALNVVAVNGLGHLRQHQPVHGQPSAGEALSLTAVRGLGAVRHGGQTVAREAQPPRPPREGSARLTGLPCVRGPPEAARVSGPRLFPELLRQCVGESPWQERLEKATEEAFKISDWLSVLRTAHQCF